MIFDDTIFAPASGNGGAIAIIRISGKNSFSALNSVFHSKKNKEIEKSLAGTHLFGLIKDNERIIDEVVINIYASPQSYTGEDMVEIFCHASAYIQKEIFSLLIKQNLRMANPGEFTVRAFYNGKMDLSQAEAVADIIASENRASHKLAINQLRGGFTKELASLRDKLVKFISLIELELDFSEEEVEFANRKDLLILINELIEKTGSLKDSFRSGNAIKNGIPVTIAGRTNVGKSTLLNAILNEEKAIVSDIHGTTRDSIEDIISIKGTGFRFIDTAGIRTTADKIESLGIERTFNKIRQAQIILLLVNSYDTEDSVRLQLSEIKQEMNKDQKLFLVINKSELKEKTKLTKMLNADKIIEISARERTNLNSLTEALLEVSKENTETNSSFIVTNIRHYEALTQAYEALARVETGLKNNLSGDLLSSDIRQVMNYIGEISGNIDNSEILNKIFSDFCIGK